MSTMTDDTDAGVEDTLTLTEHLAELRTRIIRSALAVLIGMVVIIAFYDHVLVFLKQPYVDLCNEKPAGFCDPSLFIPTPTEGLSTRIRVGMYGGIIAALPVILWQIWRFVVPALHAKDASTPSRSCCRRSCCSRLAAASLTSPSTARSNS